MNSSSHCGAVVERHVPKTAGTTVRTMLKANEERSHCEYFGYDLGRVRNSCSTHSLSFAERMLVFAADVAVAGGIQAPQPG